MTRLLPALALLFASSPALGQTILPPKPDPDQPAGEGRHGSFIGGLGYVNPGFSYAFALDREGSRSAPGLELSYMNFPRHHAWDTGYGAFGNVLFYGPGDRRYALGFQAGSLLGVEAGFAYRTAHGELGATPGAQLGLYASIGAAMLAARGTLALRQKDAMGRRTSGNEATLALGVKLPLRVHGEDRTFRFMGGG